MAGSLGTLQIDVLANIAGMVSDLGKAQAETNKFAESAKHSIEGIGEAFKGVAELFGVGLGVEALKEVAAKAFETAEQLDHLSQATGIAVDTLQTMQSAATLSGTSLEIASTAIEKLEKAAVEATTGNTKLAGTFNAIGISSKQLGELLKDPDALIQEVTKHLSEFSNGAEKTTAVMQLMGRGAAQNIPLINELGEKFQELTLQAQKFGIQLSALDQGQLKGAAEGVNELKDAAEGLGNQFGIAVAPAVIAVSHALVELATSGPVQQFFIDLRDNIAEFVVIAGKVRAVIAEWLPAVTDSFNGMDDDVAQFFADAFTLIDKFATQFKNGLVYVQAGFVTLWAEVQTGFNTAIAFIERQLGTLAAGLSQVVAATGNQIGAIELKGLSDGLTKLGSSAKTVTADLTEFQFRVQSNNLDLALAKKSNDAWAQSVRDEAKAMLGANAAHDAGHKSLLQLPQDLGQASKAAQKLAQDMVEATKFLDGLAGKLDGEYTKAWAGYEGAIDTADKMAKKFLADGMAMADVQRFIAEATDLARTKLYEQTDATYNLDKAIGEANQALSKQQALVGLTGTALAVETEYQKLLNAAMKDMQGVMGPLTAAEQARIESLHGIAAATVAAQEAQKNYSQVMKEWEGIATQGLDSVGKSIAGFATGSIKSWKDFGASLVDDTKQFIAAIIQEFLKLTVFNGIINSLFGSNLPTGIGGILGGGGSGGAAGGAGSLLSAAGSGSSLLGGGGGLAGILGKEFGGVELGNILSIGGGIFAGLSEFKNAGGGAAGLAGGAAYGLGAYELGTVGSAAIGGFGAAGAGGALAGGSAALGAIPVIGWVAIAALVVDKLSGGKLFGTAYKPTGNTSQDITIGGDSAKLTNSIEESKQSALFGGKKWRDLSVAATADQAASIDTLFKGISDSVAAAANGLGVAVPTIIGGAFKETFDKSGKMTSQLSTVLGKSYSETLQQFAERVTADNLLALLPAAQNAQAIADKWQSSADTLLAGTELLVQAQADIQKGNSLIGGDTSLANIADEVQKLAGPSESLIQAYARLGAEETDLSNVQALLGIDTGKTGTAFLEFADSLATVAGGLQNLDTLWGNYYTEFYSDSEKQANTLKVLQGNVTSSFNAIGESTSVSMAQFRKDFEAALPSLTPEQVVEWLQAGDALAKLNSQLGQTGQAATAATDASTKAYNDFVSQFNPQTLGMTDFESSLNDISGTLQQNIDQANALAKAAGLSGASLEDIGNIIQASAQKGAAALKQLEAQATSLAQSLYGTGLDQLNTQLKAAQDKYAFDHANSTLDYAFGGSDQKNIDAIQKQIDAANAQAEAAKRVTDASSLFSDLGQIGAVTGESLDQLGARFSIPLDKFAADLGVTNDQLRSQFQTAEDMATATIQSRDLLQQILNSIDGKSSFEAANVVTRGGVGGQATTFGQESGMTALQAQTIIAHLSRIETHTGGTSTNTGDLLRTGRQPLPFGRNVRAPA